jgi:hypothetical protein
MIHTNSETPTRGLASTVEQPGRRCLPEALSALRAGAITLVRFEYAGQADYRRMKPVAYHDASGRPTRSQLSRTTRQEIDVFFHELLELRFPDWAVAEGSRGELEWNVETDELTHRHQWRVISYDEVTLAGLTPPAV